MTFRVKVVPPCKDCHYFYADSIEDADQMVQDLEDDLDGLGCDIWVYAETRYGHVRVR